MSAGDKNLRKLVAEYPDLGFLQESRITRIPGSTHRVHEVRSDSVHAALKIREDAIPRFISADQESRNETFAARLGIAPELIFCNAEVRLSRWLDDTRSLDASEARQPELIRKFAQMLVRLHTSTPVFSNAVTVEMALQWNIEQTLHAGDEHPEWREIYAFLRDRVGLERTVSCHGDPVCANILSSQSEQSRLYLIDWEYSHATTPYWDLAIFSNDANLDADGCRLLLGCYEKEFAKFGTDPELELPMLQQYQRVLGLITDLWLDAHSSK